MPKSHNFVNRARIVERRHVGAVFMVGLAVGLLVGFVVGSRVGLAVGLMVVSATCCGTMTAAVLAEASGGEPGQT